MHDDHRDNSSAIPRLRQFASIAAWPGVFLVLTTLLQLYVPYPVDDDTAYHFTVGQLIRKYGILHDFPWTTFSLQHGQYADKEFFFHLLFVPIGGLGFVDAARLVGALAGALVLIVIYLILRKEQVPYAGLWALLPLTCSEFVFRLALVRPHLISIALALVVAWAITRQRLAVLGLAAALYPMCYVAFWQIPLIVLTAAAAAWLAAGRLPHWQPAVTLAAGLGAGLVLHPNTLNLLKLNWIHMSDVLVGSAWGRSTQNLGRELNPYTVNEWGTYLVIVLLLTVGALLSGWKERRSRPEVLAFALAAAAFGLLTGKSLRFVEYFVPFAVVAGALAAKQFGRPRWLAPAVLGVALLYQLGFGAEPFQILAEKKPYLTQEIAGFFRLKIPSGAQVFTTDWDYTGNLMLELPERRFIVAADPTLFQKKDPFLYEVWCRIPLDVPLDATDAIRVLFKSRYVISQNIPAYGAFFQVLEADPRVRTLFANQQWVLFDLGESSPASLR
jgi:hypothetical protein